MVELGKLVAQVAPTLATALGGPLAGAAMQLLGEVLGVDPEKEAVTTAINSNDPEVVKASLARAEAEFRAAAEQAVTVQHQIDAHVQLVQMDYARGLFYSAWRPLAGWMAVLFAGACCALVVRDAWTAQYGFLVQAPSVLMIGGPLMALAGIYSWTKSEERKTAMRSGGSGVLGTVQELIAKARG